MANADTKTNVEDELQIHSETSNEVNSPCNKIYVLVTEHEKLATHVETLTKENSTMRNTEYNLKFSLNDLHIQICSFLEEILP